ncbi:MAG TPA: PilZ domain-containing protein [Spirochaetota bacterium]|nr:PilZ domain-containing protein [Spirochaetota bacterium]
MSNEKRKYKRFTIEQFVEFSYMHETFVNAEGINLSEGGILCKTTYPIEPLDKAFIMLKIPLKDKEYILKLNGVIAHYQKMDNYYLFGVEFTDVEENDKKILKEYLTLLK